MTKNLNALHVDSFADAISSVPLMVERFKESGIVLVQGHKFSEEEQMQVTRLLGDELDWHLHSEVDAHALEQGSHHGGQSIDPDKEYNSGKNDYLLDWHIEQVYFTYPPMGGVWYMSHFSGPEGSGHTRFVDSAELFNLFSEEDKEFFRKSIVLWDKPCNEGAGPFYTQAVVTHPLINKEVLRIETDAGCRILPTLYSYDGRKPSEQEQAKFDLLLKTLKQELTDNISIRYEQNWREGDLILVDLFRMYHAVMGGFGYNERLMFLIVANSKYNEIGLHNIAPELR
jgi:alpha-ketoglutarate-dependent taurine dioxygenase